MGRISMRSSSRPKYSNLGIEKAAVPSTSEEKSSTPGTGSVKFDLNAAQFEDSFAIQGFRDDGRSWPSNGGSFHTAPFCPYAHLYLSCGTIFGRREFDLIVDGLN